MAEFVKKGIYRGGGTAVEFNTIAACDGIAQSHAGMHYILPSREIICNSIEIAVQAHRLDAIVLLASCDKIVPGMLMAAARLDIPAILVNGGPALGGMEFDGRESDSTALDEARGMYTIGEITQEELLALENVACPSCGSCSFLGTANTMCCIAEALGMSLPGSALVPATHAERLRLAYLSGIKICQIAFAGLNARQILTEEALRNGIKTSMAICGSTNAVLHLSAIAHEAELGINVVEEFARLNETTPQIVKVNPAASWNMEDFYKAGGIPRVMENLEDIIDGNALTCTGGTVAENLDDVSFVYPENTEVIRKLSNPFSKTGGIAVLRGNLAPDTAISKPGAFDKSLYEFTGKAKVFNCEEDAEEAILNGEIVAGHVVVIRYEGPKGGPGMREMYRAMKYLYGMGLGQTTALITDGRFSGTNNGCFVGHISPEAAEGGPIAIVNDGDEITIDINRGIIHLHISDAEMAKRYETLKHPQKDIPRGYLRLYAKMASSADKGAIIEA